MQTDNWRQRANQKVFMMILAFRKIFSFSIGLLMCFSALLKAQSLEIGEFHALLIANQNYQYWNDLNTPHNDVEKIAEILRDNYGFSTKVIKDATSAGIIDAIDEYRNKLTSNDNFLIYYAGHGEVRGNASYWVGVNGRRTTSGNWIDLNRVNNLIDAESGMRARHVLVIADSCFSGNIFRGAEEFITPFNINSLAWHQAQIKPTSRTALTSGANEPVLDRATNQSSHSVFAKELIRQLKNQRSVISAGKLHQLIEKDVFARAKRQNLSQSPQYGSISGTGHLGGDFIFIPRGNKTAFINLNQESLNSAQENLRGDLPNNGSALNISGLSPEKQTLLDNCNNGDMYDCFSLGYDFSNADGVAQDYSKAHALYVKACDGGDAGGCTNLGYLYTYGLGVTQNYTIARELYLKGCDGGNALGCANLGYLYDEGLGVTQNYTKARELYLKGCDGGNARGCANLGSLYDEGLGVTQNYSKAHELYLKACDGGDAGGCNNLGYLYDRGLGITQNYTKAHELYLLGCEGGNKVSCYNLGNIYKFGQGVDKDIVKALSFYQKACNLGKKKACEQLN